MKKSITCLELLIVAIRKIELEAQKLQEQTGAEPLKESQGHWIYLDHSDGNNIQILVDPRFPAWGLTLFLG